ncbi:MAG TPA: response regulator transcription factor [Armatimonadota bacterium]|nr:response regulator transcription factor [Armatimonadota bacterium]
MRGIPGDVIVVTERASSGPIRMFLQQLEQLGYVTHVIRRMHYGEIRRLPEPQLVMLDVTSQDFRSTESIPANVRAVWEHVPVLLLACSGEMGYIRYNPNLSDFISLPITFPELETRLRFVLIKISGTSLSRDVIRVSDLTVNTSTYEVRVENQLIDLTYKEFELLKFFLTHQRRVFSREELLETVWESDYYGGTRTVDVHIRRLRAKLGVTIGNMIHTVRNVGYRFG